MLGSVHEPSSIFTISEWQIIIDNNVTNSRKQTVTDVMNVV